MVRLGALNRWTKLLQGKQSKCLELKFNKKGWPGRRITLKKHLLLDPRPGQAFGIQICKKMVPINRTFVQCVSVYFVCCCCSWFLEGIFRTLKGCLASCELFFDLCMP